MPNPSALDQSVQDQSIQDQPTAAYIHIPFCRRRCFYCDFPISVVGDRPPLARHQTAQNQNIDGFGTIAEYIEVLCQEIQATPSQATSATHQPLQTVFFGGGTPSLLTEGQLAQVLETLQQRFGIASDAEISMEIDPDTFDYGRLQGYCKAGVNRISLGVQALQTELLKACGRTHTREDIDAAVALIHQVGLTNFSLDLISGLPHQTIATWQDSLDSAIALSPTHISVYDLTVEPGTAFARWYQPGVEPLPTDAMTVEMYRLAQHTLTQAGYQHYEVSNYAKPGYQCRHNRVYWQNRPYYGFGMGAASYTQGQRFTRPRKRREYYQWAQEFSVAGKLDCPMTPPEEVLQDTLMLGLRLSEGLSLATLITGFGHQAVQQILTCLKPYWQKNWVEFIDQTGQVLVATQSQNLTFESLPSIDSIRLSDPEGFLFSNVVLSDLFNALS